VQEVGREAATGFLQLPRVWLMGGSTQQGHSRLLRGAPALPQIAGTAGGDDILPGGAAAARAGDDVVKGQVLGQAALSTILTGETVAQEDVEAGEGGLAILIDVVLQRDDAGQLHLDR